LANKYNDDYSCDVFVLLRCVMLHFNYVTGVSLNIFIFSTAQSTDN